MMMEAEIEDAPASQRIPKGLPANRQELGEASIEQMLPQSPQKEHLALRLPAFRTAGQSSII